MKKTISSIAASATSAVTGMFLSEKQRLEKEKARIAAREFELAEHETKTRQVRAQRDLVLLGQRNLAAVIADTERRLAILKAKCHFHVVGRICNEGTAPRSFVARISEARTEQRHLEDFLEKDVPVIRKHLAERLTEVTKELEELEKADQA